MNGLTGTLNRVPGTKYLLTDEVWDALWDGLRKEKLLRKDGKPKVAELARLVEEVCGELPERATMSAVLKTRPSELPRGKTVRSEFLVAMLVAVGKPGWLALELSPQQRELLRRAEGIERLTSEDLEKILDDFADRVRDKLAVGEKKRHH